MRRLLTVICTLLLSASVSGQQIKSRPVGFDDFRSLLEAAGYEAFGFDLSELLEGPGRYDMTVYIKEIGRASCRERVPGSFPAGRTNCS